MSTGITKATTFARALRQATAPVRDMQDEISRARDIFEATIARAVSEYIDRVSKAAAYARGDAGQDQSPVSEYSDQGPKAAEA